MSARPGKRLHALVDGMLAARSDLTGEQYDPRHWEGLLAAAMPLTVSRVINDAKSPGDRAVVSRDGTLVLITSQEKKTSYLLELRSGQLRKPLSGGIGPVGFTADGSAVWTADDETLRRWEVRTGRLALSVASPDPRIDVYAAALSWDGKWIAQNAAGSQVGVWQTDSGRPVGSFEGCEDHEGRARAQAFAFSPDGKLLAFACSHYSDHSVRLLDIAAKKTRSLIERSSAGGLGAVASLAFAPDGKELVAAGGNGVLAVFAIPGGHRGLRIHGNLALRSAAFSWDGKKLCAAGEGGAAHIYDRETGQILQTLEGHAGAINSAQFLPGDRELLTASDDQTVRIWELYEARTALAPTGHEVTAASYFDNGRKVVTVGNEQKPLHWAVDQTLRLWDASTGRGLADSPLVSGEMGDKGDYGEVLAMSPPGDLLLTRRAFQGIAIRDGRTLKVRHEIDVADTGVLVTPDARSLLLTKRDSNQVQLVDTRSGRQMPSWALPEADAVFALSPDGTRVLASCPAELLNGNNAGCLRDAASGRVVLQLRASDMTLFAAEFSPDCKRAVGVSESGRAGSWDLRTGVRLLTSSWEYGTIERMSFSANGRRVLVSAGANTVQVHEASTLAPLLKEPLEEVKIARLSPDGKRLLYTKDQGRDLTIWDLDAGKVVLTLTGHKGAILSASYSPDGQRILTASADGSAAIWSASSGQRLSQIRREVVEERPAPADAARPSPRLYLARLALPEKVREATFSADGARILTVAESAAVVWDAATYRHLHWLNNNGTEPIHAAVFSSDSARVLMATSYGGPHEGDSSVVLQWNARSGDPLQTLDRDKEPPASLAMASDAKGIAVAACSGSGVEISLYDAHKEKALRKIALSKPGEDIRSLALSPDGSQLLVVAKSGVSLWDTASGKSLLTLLDENEKAESLHAVFSQDGKRVAIAGQDGVARILDAKTGAMQLRLPGHRGAVTSVQFSFDGKRLVTSGKDSQVRLWDSETGKPLLVLELPAVPTSVSLFPDGGRLLVAADAAYVYSTRYADYYAFGCRVLRSLPGLQNVSEERLREALSACR